MTERQSRESALENLLQEERERSNGFKQCYQILKEERAKLQDELTLCHDKLKDLTSRNEKLISSNDANIRKLEAKVKEQQSEITALLKKLKVYNEKRNETAVFEQATTHYEKKIKELHLETDKVREQYNDLHYENTVLKCKFEGREAEYSRTLERINLQHQNEIQQLQTKIESLEKEGSLPADTFAVELKSSKREVLQLNSKVKALLAECEESRTQNETLSLQISSLSKSNSKLISDHLNNMQALESEKSTAVIQQEILKKELANSEEHRKFLSNELNTSRLEVGSLKNKLEECEHKHRMTLTNFQVDMGQFKASRESEREQFMDEISRLKSELQNLHDHLAKEQQSMMTKEQDLQQNLSAARQQLWKQAREMDQEKSKLERKMKELESERDYLISQLRQEITNLTQKLNLCSTSKAELEKEVLSLRGQLGDASKQTEGQPSEAPTNRNLNYEKEIKDLKERIDLLSAGTFTEYGDGFHKSGAKSETRSDHEVMQLRLNWEQQKLQFQQRLEELESQLREYRSTSTAEKRELEFKVKQYMKQLTKQKEKLEVFKSQNEELEYQNDILEKNISPEIHFQVKNQLTELQRRLEKYRSIIAADPNLSTKNAPSTVFSEKLLTDIQNIPFQTVPQQVPSQQTDPFRNLKEKTVEKDVSKKSFRPRRKSIRTREKRQQTTIVSSSSDLDLENL